LQCDGETPIEKSSATHVSHELEDLPDVVVETTGSGSMMQEVFLVFTKHFVYAYHQSTNPWFCFWMAMIAAGTFMLSNLQ